MANRRGRKRFYDDDKAYAEAQRLIKLCAEKGRKTLDLWGLDLKNIPPEIAYLQNLSSLNIKCYTTTIIPDCIGNMLSLKKLNLYLHSVTEEDEGENILIPRLPEFLGNLVNLQTLTISGDFLEIPHWFGNFDKLTSLSIYAEGIKTIPAEIGKLKRLSNFIVKSSCLKALPDEIAECPLVSISLLCPKFSSLPETFGKLKKLEKFTGYYINQISDIICDCESLSYLYIRSDSISSLPENIGNLKKLKYLHIDRVINQIPKSLRTCPLEELHLSGDFESIPQTFGYLTQLRELYLSSDKLKILPNSFGNFISLQKLTLLTNNMTALPKSLGKCNNLKTFEIHSDKLEKLPETFISLKKLQNLTLNTFVLKELPALFGNLSALESIDIFSGALTQIPESIGSLKKLKEINLDAYHVKELPESFANLFHVIEKNITAWKPLQKTAYCNRRRTSMKLNEYEAKFYEMTNMSNKYIEKILETCSLKELESLLLNAPRESVASEKEKEIVRDIMLKRWYILYDSFRPIKKNVLNIVEASEKFIKTWEEAFIKAKVMIDAIYEKEPDKDSFFDNYEVEIKLTPENLYKNPKTDELVTRNDINSYLEDYMDKGDELSITDFYNPVTGEDGNFWEDIFIDRETNWNTEPPMPDCFKDHYISYAIHVLYDHNYWALQDIIRINNIEIDIKIRHRSETRKN